MEGDGRDLEEQVAQDSAAEPGDEGQDDEAHRVEAESAREQPPRTPLASTPARSTAWKIRVGPTVVLMARILKGGATCETHAHGAQHLHGPRRRWHPLHVNRWLPEGTPRAVVQVAHGMAEHSDRYERFAEALTGAGFAVYAADHRWHKGTAGTHDAEGYWADHDGWDTVVDDPRP